MKIVESIKSIDQFGLEIKLKFNKKDKQKSFIGGLLSLIIMILIATAAYSLITTVLFKKTVEVSASREFRKEPQKVNIVENNYTFQFSLIKAGKVLRVEDALKYVTIKGAILKRTYSEATNDIVLSKDFSFDFRPCKEIKNSIMDDYFGRHLDSSAESKANTFQICPDLRDSDIAKFEIGGHPSFADNYKVVLVHVYPCVSGLGRHCAPESEITDLVTPMRIPRFTFEPENVKTPVSEVDVFDQIPLALRRVTIFNFTLQQEFIEDESIFSFMGAKEKAHFLEIEVRLSTAPSGTPRTPTAPFHRIRGCLGSAAIRCSWSPTR